MTVWAQLGQDIDGEAPNDWSGYSVSLSADGNTVAIGANDNNGNGTKPDSGHVRVYRYSDSDNVWTQRGQDIDGEASSDQSGYSVSLSADGNTVAIGAVYNDGNGSNSGHVRVYRYSDSDNVWTQRGSDIDGEAAGYSSGWSVSLSADGNTVAIGEPFNTDFKGQVRVYGYSNNNNDWLQRGTDIVGEASGDGSGISVSLSADGNIVAIGANGNSGSSSYSGQVRVYGYSNNNNDWLQRGQDIDGEASSDNSGDSVSLSADGNTVAIGAPYNNGNGTDSGHVRVYGYSDSDNVWNKRGGDIDGEAAYDESGYSVSLSADGNTVAIGARYNDGNGSNSGHVRVYGYSNNVWTQQGGDINGEAASDESGYSVSLSADGNTVAIGARYNDGHGSNSGQVRVYGLISVPQISNVYISNNYEKYIYIVGTKFKSGDTVSFEGPEGVSASSSYSVEFINAELLKVTMISPYDIDTVRVTDIYGNISNTFTLTPNLISNICFIAGTPVTTDQGNIPIEKIDTSIHTIRNKKIVAITTTVTQDKYLVCFEKDALGKNIPSQKTIISKNHKLFYNGKMRMAKEFLKEFDNVTKVKYTGSVLYNVLLEEHDKMMVNNLICETLHPENGVAKVYMALQNLDTEGQKSLIKKINAHVIKNNVFTGSKKAVK